LHLRASDERQRAGQQSEHNYSKCPNVGGKSRIAFTFHNLWRHVRGRTTKGSQLRALGSNLSREAKIDDLHSLGAFVKKKVLQFQVSMHNEAVVAKADTFDDLLVEALRHTLLESMIWLALRECSK
jgi:hypothetical protein